MQEFFTARELAEIAKERKLPTFPQTESGVIRLSEREGWRGFPASLVRRKAGRGGGFEYHWSILPGLMQMAITARQAQERLVVAHEMKRLAADRQLASLQAQGRSDQAKGVERARGEVLTSIEGYAISHGRTRAWAIARFVEAQRTAAKRQEIEARLGAGEILTPAEAAILTQPSEMTAQTGFDLPMARLTVANDRKGGGIVSERTIWRWFKARDEGGFAALTPVPPREVQPIPPAFAEFMKIYAAPSKPTIAAAHAEYMRRVDARDGIQFAPVTLSQCRAILRHRLNNIEKHIGREGILTLKSRMAYIQRSTDDLWPTTIYTADGKTFDAEVADPVSSRPMKPEITSVLDVATRKCVGFAISRKENVIAVTEALRRSCLIHGVPAIFYTDRGAGYKNKTFDGDGGVELGGLMGRLGIAKMHALPYNSQAKGIVERFNAQWNDLARHLPTYLGRDMDKEAKQKVHKTTRSDVRVFGSSHLLPSWGAFLTMCEEAIARYNDTPHSALPRFEDPETGRQRHMSPNEAWAAQVARGFEPVTVADHDADDLFRPYEVRTVRRALVEWNTNTYFHADLEAWHEKRVAVGYDLHQADRVWVRSIDEESGQPGHLICVAIFGGNTERYVPLTFQRAAEEGRAKAQLRRLGKKAEAVEDQLRTPMIDMVRPIVAGDLTLVPQEAPAAPEPVRPQPQTAAITTDADLAKLCLADPGQLTSGRARILREVMSRRNGRELLRISGVDLDELDDLLRSAA